MTVSNKRTFLFPNLALEWDSWKSQPISPSKIVPLPTRSVLATVPGQFSLPGEVRARLLCEVAWWVDAASVRANDITPLLSVNLASMRKNISYQHRDRCHSHLGLGLLIHYSIVGCKIRVNDPCTFERLHHWPLYSNPRRIVEFC